MKRTALLAASLALLFTAATATAAPDAEAGKAKAASCNACHGARGEGNAKNPPIAGLEQKKFVQDMQDYKSGKRAHGAMKFAASKLTDEDFANLAAYYATLRK